MRTLEINKQVYYHAKYIKKTPIKEEDDEGNLLETGEWELIYGDPIRKKGNISASKGEADVEIFGIDTKYDKVIIPNYHDTDIKESSVLWIDTFPEFDENGKTKTPWDYTVTKIAKSLNSTLIAVSKVNVSL